MERKMAEGSQNRENGKETVRFFSPHEYEYMTVTVENGFRNGPAVLYEHGFKKLEWTFKDGKRSGLFTVFKRGMRLFSGWWNEDGEWDSRYLVQYTPESIVFNQYHPTTGNLVYTGGMGDNPRVREGWGLTFDPVSGQPLEYGLFASNSLVRRYQRFEDDDMFETSYEDDASILGRPSKEAIYRVRSSMNVSSRVVYVGGYAQKGVFMVRDGRGCEVTATGVVEGEWSLGEQTRRWAVRDGVREEKRAFVCSPVFEMAGEGGDSFKRSDDSFKRTDDSFKRSDDSFKRSDDSFKRSVNDDSFKRTDDSFKRTVGDDSFKRSVGDDSFKRSEDSFKRTVGDDSFKRSDDSFKRSDDSFKRPADPFEITVAEDTRRPDDSFRRPDSFRRSDDGYARGPRPDGFKRGAQSFPRRAGANEWKPKPRYGDAPRSGASFGGRSLPPSPVGARPAREAPVEYQTVSSADALVMYKQLMEARGIDVEDSSPAPDTPANPLAAAQPANQPFGQPADALAANPFAANSMAEEAAETSPQVEEKIEEIKNTKEFEEEDSEDDRGLTTQQQQALASLFDTAMGGQPAGNLPPTSETPAMMGTSFASSPLQNETSIQNETPIQDETPAALANIPVDVAEVQPPTLTRVVDDDEAPMTAQQQQDFANLFAAAATAPVTAPVTAPTPSPAPATMPVTSPMPASMPVTTPIPASIPVTTPVTPTPNPAPANPATFTPTNPEATDSYAFPSGGWQRTAPFIPTRSVGSTSSAAPAWAPRTMVEVASQWLPEKALATKPTTPTTPGLSGVGGDEGRWRPEGLSSAIKTTKPRTVTTLSLPAASEEVPFECVLRTSEEYQDLSVRVTAIVIAEGCLNEGTLWRLDLSDCKLVKTLRVGSRSLQNVDEVRLCDMKALETVTLGDEVLAITQTERDGRRFTMCGLEKLREVVVGDHTAEEFFDLEVRGECGRER